MSPKHMVPVKERSVVEPGAFESLGGALEDLFDRPLRGREAFDMPRMNVRETDKTIEISVALFGVDKKDINLDLSENSLAISGERREEKDEKDAGGYRLKEQNYGRFYRSFCLPSAVKTGDAKAVYKDGILKITLQKQQVEKPHLIPVK